VRPSGNSNRTGCLGPTRADPSAAAAAAAMHTNGRHHGSKPKDIIMLLRAASQLCDVMRSSWPQPSAPPNHARCSMGPGLAVVCPPDWPAVASSSRAEPSGVDCLRFSPLSLRRPHCLCSGSLRHLLLKADEWMGGLPHREQQHRTAPPNLGNHTQPHRTATGSRLLSSPFGRSASAPAFLGLKCFQSPPILPRE
jgi:hypothetical protein